ncbi:hypothetical protein IFM89_010799 [Coptis chinensis]|uniref:Peroxidase n=1 Tax=Coptis chinensis TaxID=261450 RepID=A0A835M5N2_9MAGN|nr:hypothetical protein IFM89_010799 [Coptis chinensis]
MWIKERSSRSTVAITQYLKRRLDKWQTWDTKRDHGERLERMERLEKESGYGIYSEGRKEKKRGICHGGELRKNFYKDSCPQAEEIIMSIIWKRVASNSTLPSKFLRMHFHDSFVRGCDASVLLNSTPNNKAEKEAMPNLSLAGFDVIDKVKTQLEKTCPGTVSCADIVALAARDSVSYQLQKPMWEVLTGRRDGKISSQSEALANIPSSFWSFSILKQNFSSKGLTVHDLVVLSGSPTIGVGHCNFFSNRLYNFTGKGDSDPSLNSTNLRSFVENKMQKSLRQHNHCTIGASDSFIF